MDTHQPDRQSLQTYVRVAADCSRVLLAVSDDSRMPVPASDRSIDLNMGRNCQHLQRAVLDQIDARFGQDSKDLGEWEKRVACGDTDYVREEDAENDFDAAAALLCGCVLSVNMLARLYYERHRDCEALSTVIRRLTQLTPPALKTLFGDELPAAVRDTWPHLTGLYEVHLRRH